MNNPSLFLKSLFGQNCIWCSFVLLITKSFAFATSSWITSSWITHFLNNLNWFVWFIERSLVYIYLYLRAIPEFISTFSDETCSWTTAVILLSCIVYWLILSECFEIQHKSASLTYARTCQNHSMRVFWDLHRSFLSLLSSNDNFHNNLLLNNSNALILCIFWWTESVKEIHMLN